MIEEIIIRIRDPKGIHIKWPPEPLLGPGTAAEWTAGGFFMTFAKKRTPNNNNSGGGLLFGGGPFLFGGRGYLVYDMYVYMYMYIYMHRVHGM